MVSVGLCCCCDCYTGKMAPSGTFGGLRSIFGNDTLSLRLLSVLIEFLNFWCIKKSSFVDNEFEKTLNSLSGPAQAYVFLLSAYLVD